MENENFIEPKKKLVSTAIIHTQSRDYTILCRLFIHGTWTQARARARSSSASSLKANSNSLQNEGRLRSCQRHLVNNFLPVAVGQLGNDILKTVGKHFNEFFESVICWTCRSEEVTQRSVDPEVVIGVKVGLADELENKKVLRLIGEDL